MSNLPWLTLLGLIPLVGALVVAFLPSAEAAKKTALGVSLVALAVGIGAATQFQIGSSEQFQLVEQHSWIPQFGVSYALGVDGIALTLILLALILTPICLLAAWNDLDGEQLAEEGRGSRRVQTYFALMLLLVTFMVGVFAATDVFLFYVFFEAMLIPVYFLVGSFGGGARRKAAALKFLIFGLVGGLIMLVAVIGLYFVGPGGSEGFLISSLTGLDIDPHVEKWLFVGFFIAFAIKAPMWPVHTWLPDTAQAARPATSVLLVGVLDKVGTYGMIRFCLQLFPEASQWATPVVITLAIISVVYGAILAIAQSDFLRLIAFTSVSHFGLIILGIFAMTTTAGSGAALYMINHGFSTAALFLIVAMLIYRNHGRQRIEDFGGWQRVTPGIAGVFLVAGMAALSLPGLSTFVSEFLVFIGTYQRFPAAALLALPGVVLAAVYILWMYKRSMTGPAPVLEREVPDMNLREKIVVGPLIAALILLGVFPKVALDYLNPAVEQTLIHVGVEDPVPSQATGGER
ncbi:MAG: NADH-quinone oxidoreductase subunit M [Actinomycetia bacterium]|nr:NADH-quinone oxidoreductase subunit M [Actinomycetes bacterium]